MGEESSNIENLVIFVIATIVSVIATNWMHVGFDVLGETRLYRYILTDISIMSVVFYTLHLKGYKISFLRILMVAILLMLLMHVFLFKALFALSLFSFLSWGFCTFLFILSLRMFLNVRFKPTIAICVVLSFCSFFFTIIDPSYTFTSFAWVVSMMIPAMFTAPLEKLNEQTIPSEDEQETKSIS